jgi:SAM-dependent methyltransferase
MKQYYDSGYRQKGLTTELPSNNELDCLLANNFAGTEKDFARVIDLLQVLNLGPKPRILDYGANWGYGALQFQRAGYLVEAYEISSDRAAFGTNLGVHVETNLSRIGRDFDVVYSSHVLEHTANPLEILRQQLSRVRKGGFVIAHTPNGSSARRQRDYASFHKHWGLVHPVLLSEEFVINNFGNHPVFVSSKTEASLVRTWNVREIRVNQTDGPELLLIVRNCPVN